MRQKGIADTPKKGAPEWMVTYSDVISLLVTFFVMLLTFSTADREKFDKAKGSLKGAFGVTMSSVSRLRESGMATERYLLSGRRSPAGMDFPPEIEPLAREIVGMNSRLKTEKLGAAITMRVVDRGVSIRIPASVIFIRDAALFAPLGEEYLAKLALAVKALPNGIEVMNHTGPGSKETVRQSAWDLTHERSARVAEFLEKRWRIQPQRLTVGGMGDSRPLGRTPGPGDDRLEITLLRKDKKSADY